MEINQILKELDEFLQASIDSETPTPDTSKLNKDQEAILEKNFDGWQSPIKGAYFNSGAYGRGDARHSGRHDGVDLRAPGGTSAYPIGVGFVENVDEWKKGGNIVTILHAKKVRTYYAHLGTVSVNKGQYVDKNTVIGTVGNSGNAKNTVPHIHLEVRVDGALTDPGKLFYVPPYAKFNKDKEKIWLSYDAKQQANNFNMKEHKSAIAQAAVKLIEKYSF